MYNYSAIGAANENKIPICAFITVMKKQVIVRLNKKQNVKGQNKDCRLMRGNCTWQGRICHISSRGSVTDQRRASCRVEKSQLQS